jgi:hypothetical protein
MACKKSELVSAINSFASARVSGDGTLVQFAGSLVTNYIESLEFAPEDETAEEEAAAVAE